MAQHHPTGSETTPPYAPRSSRFVSEQPSVEDHVDVWCYGYAILELHARNNNDDDAVNTTLCEKISLLKSTYPSTQNHRSSRWPHADGRGGSELHKLSTASLRTKVKVKEVDLYSAFIVVPHTQGAQVWITQCYLQITPYLPLPHKHSPDGAYPRLRLRISNCSLLLIYLPRKDKRLSRPGWLTYSRRFTHISGHPSH